MGEKEFVPSSRLVDSREFAESEEERTQ